MGDRGVTATNNADASTRLRILADGRSGSNRNEIANLDDVVSILADGRSGSNRNVE